MVRTRKYFAIGFAIGLLVVLTACDPQPGHPCKHAGDIFAKNGTVLRCKDTPDDGLKWVN